MALIVFVYMVSAQAQTGLVPFVDCIERGFDSDGELSNNYTVYFGYSSTNRITLIIPPDSPNNFFTPTEPSNKPNRFEPGVHHRVTALTLTPGDAQTWFLGNSSAVASSTNAQLCGQEGPNSRLITYQGKLTDGTAAANGSYDLQVQLFNALTGGNARTSQIRVEDVLVANGVFTVQLDLGAASLPPNTPSQNLNPAILDAENSFFEIGVRPGTSIGAFTTLTPRQPITATPLAMRANTAATAFRAANADNAARLGGVAANQFVGISDARLSDARTPTAGSSSYIQNTTTQQTSSNFNISGNGTIGGTLSANIVNANSTNNRTLITTSSSPIGTWLGLNNTTTGGGQWNVISTGASNGEGAGKLIFFNETSGTVPFQLNGGGANIIGDLTVTGSISGASKNFKIDHPLDPLNKTLTYTSVESPEMMNIYSGTVTTDASGQATITMPAYFEALNKDFRYQLTVIGTFAQAIVAEEISGNTFKIKTDKPGVKVSWQVTGIRRDRFAEENRPAVEQKKTGAEKNKCLYAPNCKTREK